MTDSYKGGHLVTHDHSCQKPCTGHVRSMTTHKGTITSPRVTLHEQPSLLIASLCANTSVTHLGESLVRVRPRHLPLHVLEGRVE